MFTAPVYLLVGIINLFAKRQNYNIKMDNDPDFQIRVKRDLGTIGNMDDREQIINMLKSHRIERMERDTKYNLNQLNMPYTNGNTQVVDHYYHNNNHYNPYETDYTYDNSINTASTIVKRSDHYSTTHYDPFYNVKNNNNAYNNQNYNTNNDYQRNNVANTNVQLAYPNNANNGYNNNNYYYNNQNGVSNIQKIKPRNHDRQIINPTEVVTETSTITILEGNLFRFGSRCPHGKKKIGSKCIRLEDLE